MGSTAANSVELYSPQEEVYSSGTFEICTAAFLALIGFVAGTQLVGWRRWPRNLAPSATAWAGGIIGIVVACSALTLLWAEGDPSQVMPSGLYIALMVLLLFATAGYSLRLTTIAAETHERVNAKGQEK